jgi:hypothetical protein
MEEPVFRIRILNNLLNEIFMNVITIKLTSKDKSAEYFLREDSFINLLLTSHHFAGKFTDAKTLLECCPKDYIFSDLNISEEEIEKETERLLNGAGEHVGPDGEILGWAINIENGTDDEISELVRLLKKIKPTILYRPNKLNFNSHE